MLWFYITLLSLCGSLVGITVGTAKWFREFDDLNDVYSDDLDESEIW
jgi:hypothetical protein